MSAYRFLPWVRRGLATAIGAVDTLDGGASRATLPVGVRVNTAAPATTQVSVHGPGDVAGLDRRVVARQEPRPATTAFPPDHLVGIEFHPADLPWLFTPARAGPTHRLRPWLALVVVEDRDGVAVTPARGDVLARLRIEGPADPGTELPDLAESWAWAHTQVVSDAGDATTLIGLIRDEPGRVRSRLLCPRRLRADRAWIACLVPAFEVGRRTGLGLPVGDDPGLAAAWRSGDDAPDAVDLPVYLHWRFATGPAGDFEDLAARLEARPAPATAAGVPVDLGAPGSGVDPVAAAAATLVVGGALRPPPAGPEPDVDDVPSVLRERLAAVLDAAATHRSDGTPRDAPPLAPPIYTAHHRRRFTVTADDTPPWFAELNLDPRLRIAAALGARVVEANQEALMETAWAQVGDVLAANRALGQAQLSREAARRLHARHLAPLDTDRLLSLTAPLQTRVRAGGVTVARRVALSVVPTATGDAAFRRFATAGSVRRVARRLDVPPTVRLVTPINDARLRRDRGDRTPDGIVAATALARLRVPPRGDVPLDMAPVGGTGTVGAATVRAVAAALATVPPGGAARRLAARGDLTTGGVIVASHLRAVVDGVPPGRVTEVLGAIVPTALGARGAAGLALRVTDPAAAVGDDERGRDDDAPGVTLHVLDVDDAGRATLRTEPGQPDEEVEVLTDPSDLDDTAPGERTPIGAVPRPRPPDVAIPPRPPVVAIPPRPPVIPVPPRPPRPRPPGGGGPPRPRPPIPPTIPVPLPDRDRLAIRRMKIALARHAVFVDEPGLIAAPPPRLVPDALRATLLADTDPVTTVVRRTQARLRIAGPQDAGHTADVRVSGELGPVLATPRIDRPLYRELAALDPGHLLPGLGDLPVDTITVLATDPRFVAAFLAGANVELARELRWREYPTDRRGTPLRRFWDRVDDRDEIRPIHTWSRRTDLGGNLIGGGDLLVLLVRGELLRRYPRTILAVVRATAAGRLDDRPDARSEPVMTGRFEPDVAFAGFDLRAEEALEPPGVFFVLQQPADEPRFGFDGPRPGVPAQPATWRDATWDHVAVEPGGHLRLAGNPMAGLVRDGARFGGHAGDLAAITLQRPAMVAVHASVVLDGGEGG